MRNGDQYADDLKGIALIASETDGSEGGTCSYWCEDEDGTRRELTTEEYEELATEAEWLIA